MARGRRTVFERIEEGQILPLELRDFIKRHTVYTGLTDALGGSHVKLRNILQGITRMDNKYFPHLEHLIKEAQKNGLEARKQENKLNAYS
jgi:hypothetical protein